MPDRDHDKRQGLSHPPPGDGSDRSNGLVFWIQLRVCIVDNQYHSKHFVAVAKVGRERPHGMESGCSSIPGGYPLAALCDPFLDLCVSLKNAVLLKIHMGYGLCYPYSCRPSGCEMIYLLPISGIRRGWRVGCKRFGQSSNIEKYLRKELSGMQPNDE